MIHSTNLSILQYNLNKSQSRTHSLLNDPATSTYGILALQEQYWSDFLDSSLLHPSWTIIEAPKGPEGEQPRSAIYINNRKLQIEDVEIVQMPFRDVTAITISSTHYEKPLLLINIYNPHDYDLMTPLQRHIHRTINAQHYSAIFALGDFNLHHPLWNPPEYQRYDNQADTLVDMMATLELSLLIPEGTITLPDRGTAIDLVWGNETAEAMTLRCGIAEKNDHGSDHLPIETILNMTPRAMCQNQPYNFEKANWKLMEEKIREYLPYFNKHAAFTVEELEAFTKETINAVAQAIEETTPRKNPSPFSKRWWTEELTKSRKEVNCLRNRYRRTRNEAYGNEWRIQKRIYETEIKKAKEKTWREFTKEADENTIWLLKKYLTSRPTQPFIPTLNETAAGNKQKAKLLHETFFPPPPDADLSDMTTPEQIMHPEPVPFNPNITEQQLERAIAKLAPKKAPGPDNITNRVLKQNQDTLKNHLLKIAQSSLNMGHFPSPFKNTLTVVLRKPNKPDYTKPSAYRPIALESTIGKLIESIIAESMSYLIEKHELLPPNHFGGRPGRSTEDALMILSESINQAWRQGKMFTAIFMDVTGAFNHVHHKRLIHNMRERKIPNIIVMWVENFLKSRTTQLRFNGETQEAIEIPAGIPQGSPISPILFMIYNADLVDALKTPPADLAQGFIDDVAYGVSGMSAEGNVRKLKPILEASEKWRRKHGAKFDLSKYILIHFTRNNRRQRDVAVTLEDGTRIEPSEEGKYLGVIFDRKLNYRSNTSYYAKKGTQLTLAMANISRSTGGTAFPYVKLLYNAVVKPVTQYAAVVWHRPGDRKSTAHQQVKTLTTIQRRAMNAMLSTFRTTPTHILQHESETIPVHLSLENQILKSLTRMQTTPDSHPIQMWIRRAQYRHPAASGRQAFPSNLEHLVKRYPQFSGTDATLPKLETIYPFIVPPWWEKPYRTSIAATSKEQAAELHLHAAENNANNPNLLDVYTDGSGIEGHIGAAAHAPKSSSAEAHQYLGSDKMANVFTAELTAIKLAIGILDQHSHPQCTIYADSQAAIKALDKPSQQSGQYILAEIIMTIEDLKRRKPSISDLTLEWVPGHQGIPGNERADEEAKKAALEGRADLWQDYSQMRKLKSAQIMEINMHTTNLAKDKSGLKLRQVMTAPGCHKTGHFLYNRLARPQAATLARLRSGHCGLNGYLHGHNIVENPGCQCGHPKETVKHYLLQCQTFKEARRKLVGAVGSRNMRVAKLLGDRRLINDTLEFVKETGRFAN